MEKETPNTKRRWLLATAAIALLALIFSYVRLKHVNVPPELIGTWKTTNTLYADRSLEIGGVSISFATGGGTEYTGFIEDIESINDKDKVLYTISYRVDGMRNQLSFYYDASGGGTIQFKNQLNALWKKESSS
jgi:hypothetical protein